MLAVKIFPVDDEPGRHHTGTPAEVYSTPTKFPTLLLKPLRLHVFVIPPLSASTCTDLKVVNNTQQLCGTLPDFLIFVNIKRLDRFKRDFIVLRDNSRAHVAYTLDNFSFTCSLQLMDHPYKTQTSIQVTSKHSDPQEPRRRTKVSRIPGRSHSLETTNQDLHYNLLTVRSE
jgi:hypothetical protein